MDAVHRYRNPSSYVLGIFSFIFILKAVFPPFHLVIGNGMETSFGYDFIFNRKDSNFNFNGLMLYATVNSIQYAIELIVVTAIGFVTFYWTKNYGENYFHRLSKMERGLSRKEYAEVLEIIQVYSIKRKALTEETLAKCNCSQSQINYLKEYQFHYPFENGVQH